MKIGAKIAIVLAVIGFGLIIWGTIVEAGNEIDVISTGWETVILCDKGNKYITIIIPVDAAAGDTTSTMIRCRHGSRDEVDLLANSFMQQYYTFWIADADTVIIHKDVDMADIIVIRSTER